MILTRYALIPWTTSISSTATQKDTAPVRRRTSTKASKPCLRLRKYRIAANRRRLLAKAIQFNRSGFHIYPVCGQTCRSENRCQKPARIHVGGSPKIETFFPSSKEREL